jgi:hypothetical protein
MMHPQHPPWLLTMNTLEHVKVGEEDVQKTAKMGTQGHWGDG